MPCNSLFYYIDNIPKLTSFLDNKKEHPEVFLYELIWWAQGDLNSHDLSPDSKSGASANSAMGPYK